MNEISFESICKKLGFDFTKWKSDNNIEDDSTESPFRILTNEELEWAINYIKDMNHTHLK